MRDRDTTPDLTSEAPAFARTLLTYHEREARRTLMLAAGKLSAIRADLWSLHVNLEMPEEEVSAIAEGEAQILTLPRSPAPSAATSLSMRSIVKSTARACSRSASPAGIGSTPRRERDSNGTPSSLSSCAMRLLIADGSIWASCAARAMLR